MPAPRKSANRTRERILRAAERCFTEHGYEGASLRDITRIAGVNLAAVNYHFSSKRELWLEMMQLRLVPLNAERTRMIAALRAATPKGQPLSIEKVCEAIYLPIAHVFDEGKISSALWARVVANSLNTPASVSRELNRRSIDQFWRVYRTALRDALPGLSPQELDWRFYFLMATMLGVLAWQGRQPGLDRQLDTSDLEALMRRLSVFVSHGLKNCKGTK